MSLLGLRNTILNRFKPHRVEALQRIRFNVLGLVVLFTLAALLPFPSLPSAIAATLSKRYSERWANDTMYRWTCLFEVTLSCIFAFNIFESGYAIKYPRPEPPTPKKTLNALRSPKASQNTPQKPFKIFSPSSSPLPQKPFAFSPSASLSSLGSSSSGYPTSPVSTPTRIMQYSTISTPGSGFASSTSTVSYTPSPSVSGYRGKHGSVGRALDGSYLGRIVNNESDEEED